MFTSSAGLESDSKEPSLCHPVPFTREKPHSMGQSGNIVGTKLSLHALIRVQSTKSHMVT